MNLYQLNQLRCRISRSLFKDAGKDSPNYIIEDKNKAVNILIVRPNGRLGNLLLVTPLLQEIQATFPNAKIDFFIKGGLAPILYKNYTQVENFIKLPGKPFDNLKEYIKVWTKIKRKRYDLVLGIAAGSSSGKLAVKLSKCKHKYYGLLNEELDKLIPDYKHLGKFPVYNFRKYINTPINAIESKPVPPLSLLLSEKEIEEGKILLDSLVDTSRKTIGIYTFATGYKCLKEDWWVPFYEQLKNQFPDYNILEVLPKENVSQINFATTSYYSTNIRELTAVLSHLDVFVTADCGIMHLASATNTPIVSFFSVTLLDRYEPYNNDKSKAVYLRESSQEQIIDLVKDALG